MRAYWVAVTTVVLALLISIAFFLVTLDNVRDETAEIYVIDTPTQVVEEVVTANEDGAINVIVIRCLKTDQPVLFETAVTWVSEAGESIVGRSATFQQRNAAGGAGCEGSTDDPIESSIDLPPGGLPPGTWRFVSSVHVRDALTGELLETELNNSETFRVVERD